MPNDGNHKSRKKGLIFRENIMNDFKTKYYWLFNPFPQEGDGGGGVLLPFQIFPRDLFAFLLRLPFGQFTDSLSSYPCIYEINFQNYYLEKRWGEGGGGDGNSICLLDIFFSDLQRLTINNISCPLTQIPRVDVAFSCGVGGGGVPQAQ